MISISSFCCEWFCMNLSDDSWYAVIDLLCSKMLSINESDLQNLPERKHAKMDESPSYENSTFSVTISHTHTQIPVHVLLANPFCVCVCTYSIWVYLRLVMVFSWCSLQWVVGVSLVSWSGAGDSPASLLSDSRQITMKDVPHLLSADTNPISSLYEVTLCLYLAWPASSKSTLTEIRPEHGEHVQLFVIQACMFTSQRCWFGAHGLMHITGG